MVKRDQTMPLYNDKWLIHKKDIPFKNTYTANIRAPKYKRCPEKNPTIINITLCYFIAGYF